MTQHEKELRETIAYYQRLVGGPAVHMWGFGQMPRRDNFVDEAAHDAYMEHCRMCPKHHDARGARFSKCPEVLAAWFTEDPSE